MTVPESHQRKSTISFTGPVAKFVSEPENGRLGSTVNLGSPRMAVMKGDPVRPIPQPVPNFATGPFVEDRTHDGRKVRILNVIDGLILSWSKDHP